MARRACEAASDHVRSRATEGRTRPSQAHAPARPKGWSATRQPTKPTPCGTQRFSERSSTCPPKRACMRRACSPTPTQAAASDRLSRRTSRRIVDRGGCGADGGRRGGQSSPPGEAGGGGRYRRVTINVRTAASGACCKRSARETGGTVYRWYRRGEGAPLGTQRRRGLDEGVSGRPDHAPLRRETTLQGHSRFLQGARTRPVRAGLKKKKKRGRRTTGVDF